MPLTERRYDGRFALAWAVMLLATFALAIFGRPLQHWLESLALLRWFGAVLITLLAIVLLVWLARSALRLPKHRTALVTVAGGALLAWGATFDRPEETMHLLVFGLLGLLATRAFGLAAGLPVVAACAGADELLQLYLPSRVGDWPDFMTNTVSGAVGWLIAWAQRGSGPPPRTTGAASEEQ